MSHTPGPWRIGDAGNTVFGPPNGNPSPEIVASVAKRNARLIAAAPDLLAACKAAIGYMRHVATPYDDRPGEGYDESVLAPLVAAIAKAEGRTNDRTH